MNILISAYACEPGAGSEYGVGWNVPFTMAECFPDSQIYVVSRSRCKEKIEQALAISGLMNLSFFFYDIPKWMTIKNEMQSKWGEQINYLIWQLKVRKFIRKLHKQICFDIFHHLTFNQYRTPSPGYWMDIPCVIGPIGGAETIAKVFWQDLEPHSKKKETIRMKGKDLKLFKWFNSRKNNKKLILCSSTENEVRLRKYAGNSQLKLMPAIGFSEADFAFINAENNCADKDFEMLYAGKAWDWKGLHLYLKAVKKALKDKGITSFSIRLVGIRFEDERKRVSKWIKELDLEKHVEIISFIKRDELLRLESECNLSVYPAFRDSGSMSVLEASVLGCPTICFNVGGQDIFPDDILLKIDVAETYDECVNRFADKITWAYYHRTELREIGHASKKWVMENLTWKKKVDIFMRQYLNLLSKD